jgi:hypothetical protein
MHTPIVPSPHLLLLLLVCFAPLLEVLEHLSLLLTLNSTLRISLNLERPAARHSHSTHVEVTLATHDAGDSYNYGMSVSPSVSRLGP